MQVCEFLVEQKRVVLPFLRQSAVSLETHGDETMADLVRNVLSSKTLTYSFIIINHIPYLFTLKAGFRIRIRIGSGFYQVSESVSGFRRAEMKKLPPKVEKNQEISCFEVLDVLF